MPMPRCSEHDWVEGQKSCRECARRRNREYEARHRERILAARRKAKAERRRRAGSPVHGSPEHREKMRAGGFTV